MTFGKLRGLAPSVIAMLAITLCVACATTRSLTDVERSGFLGDYSDLRPGGEGEAALVWVAPSMDFAAYDAIMIDSVTLWYASPESERLSAEDEQALTAQLYDALNRELAASYRIVEQPGPKVMRLRAAITEAEGARVVANTVTSVVPQLRMLSTLAGMGRETTALVGRAGAEAEITDSLTGRRLLAGVDARAGTKAVRGGVGKWSDVKLAFDHWAVRLRERLDGLRAGGA